MCVFVCVFSFYCKYEVSNLDIHISIYLPVYYRYLSTFNNPSIYLPTYLSSNLFGESSTSNLNLHPMSSVKLFLAWSVHLSILEVPWEWAIYLSIFYLFVYIYTPSIYSGSNPLEGIYLPICLSFYLSVYVCLSGGREVDICLCIYLSICWRRSSVINLSTSLYIIQLVLWCSMYIPIYQSTYTHLPWGCCARGVSSYPSI